MAYYARSVTAPRLPNRERRALIGTLVVLGWLAPGHAAGQEGCEAGPLGNDVVATRTLPGLGRVTYFTRPHFVCEGGVQIFADSAVAYADRGMSHLLGAVRYLESSRELNADEARYFTNEGRLQANGHVSVTDSEQGSSITNGDLVYLLQTDFRDVEEMTVVTGADGLRPVAILTPPPPSDTADVEAAPAEPYTVIGDRIFLLGSRYLSASGRVEIVRDSLLAFSDSAEYDQDEGNLLLEGSARVESSTYELEGRTITMGTPSAGSSEIHALREARLVGDNLLLTAARIVLFLEADALERLVATPSHADRGSRAPLAEVATPVEGAPPATVVDSIDRARPQATVQDYVLTADSLEVNAPNQVVERVFAVGRARSESTSRDSLNVDVLPAVARTDWLEGDTVIVTFVEPPDSETRAAELDVDKIVAIGRARSLYRLPPSDSTSRVGTDPPAVHYVVGNRITIQMSGREVREMIVVGQTRGVHLEPLARAPRSVQDTLGIRVDTTRVRPDTTAIAPERTSPRASEPLDRGPPSPPSETARTPQPVADDHARLERP